MARAKKAVLDFALDDSALLVQALGSIDQGTGWINLTPGVPSELVGDDRSLFSWLVGSRPLIAPLATWMPAVAGSGKPGSLGILHGRGRLHAEEIAKLALPPSWRCRQDHARRGLLFDVGDTTANELATIMMRVVDQLAMVTTTGRYMAEVFTRS